MKDLLEHLKSRHLNLDLYSHFLSDDCVTFPLWNLSGQMLGYQQYNPNSPKNDDSLEPNEKKYFTYLKKNFKVTENSAFGLDLLDTNKKELFVCEGVFDACRLHNLGLNAVALLSCLPKYLKSWLWSLGYTVIPVCEGDDAGRKMTYFATSNKVVYLEKGKDLGDLTDAELRFTFKEFL